MPFLPILGLIFITLKLLDVITWSWWLVLLPLYPCFVIWGFVAIVFIAAAIDQVFFSPKRRW